MMELAAIMRAAISGLKTMLDGIKASAATGMAKYYNRLPKEIRLHFLHSFTA